MAFLQGRAGVSFARSGWAILAIVVCGLFPTAGPLHAEPWQFATFTLSEELPMKCENCRPEWITGIDKVFDRNLPMNPGLITGHIVLIDLSDPKLEFMMRPRDPSGVCKYHVGPVAYTEPVRREPLPVHLMTVPEWAREAGATIAFSGPFFKFDRDVGVRAKNLDQACGELTGLHLRNGIVEWPPKDRPELLREPIDSVPDFKADAILFYPDRTAAIRSIDSFEDPELQKASYGLSGIRLYIGADINPTPGTKPTIRMARMGIGIMPDRKQIIIVQLEAGTGDKNGGFGLLRLKNLMQALGAVAAINLDGSGSAYMVGPNGFHSSSSDTEGPRPIAAMFGFRLRQEQVQWKSVADKD